jgi:hypothetical protein
VSVTDALDDADAAALADPHAETLRDARAVVDSVNAGVRVCVAARTVADDRADDVVDRLADADGDTDEEPDGDLDDDGKAVILSVTEWHAVARAVPDSLNVPRADTVVVAVADARTEPIADSVVARVADGVDVCHMSRDGDDAYVGDGSSVCERASRTNRKATNAAPHARRILAATRGDDCAGRRRV